MELTSEFRTLFILRKISGVIFLFVVCCFLLNMGLERNQWVIILISLIVIIVSYIILKNDIRKFYKIKVVKNGILKIAIFENKEKLILFRDIKEVRLEKVEGMSSDAGEITLGYYESILILNTNEKILISPDHFENYKEIMKIIKLNRNDQTR